MSVHLLRSKVSGYAGSVRVRPDPSGLNNPKNHYSNYNSYTNYTNYNLYTNYNNYRAYSNYKNGVSLGCKYLYTLNTKGRTYEKDITMVR